MTLYEWLCVEQNDVDTYDTEIDAVVTVCHIYEEEDDYDKFCNAIIKKVNVVQKCGDGLTVDWSKLIRDNLSKFKDFTKKYWRNQYEDDEVEFFYQWMNEIHMYMAGYVSESFYTTLVEFVDSLEYKEV